MRCIAKNAILQLVILVGLRAVEIPTGTDLHIRLTSRVSTADAKPGHPVTAVLIAAVVQDGQIVIPPGAEVAGEVKAVQAAAADRQKAPALQLDFKSISFDAEREVIATRVAAVDDAKEKVDDKGIVTGTPASQTYTARIDRGIEKMSDSDRFAKLAGLLEAAKDVLVPDTDPEITYDAGVEMTLRTTEPIKVARPSAGIIADVRPIADSAALADLVSHMPLRAVATDGRPSDITNMLFIGSAEQLASAFETAGWSTAAKLSRIAKFETARALIEQRGYKEAPVSVLLIGGKPPDLVYQKQNNTFDARHHLRVWRLPRTYDGRQTWVSTATHDTGISFSERDHTFIHRIDSNIDDERAKVVNDLIFARKVSGLALVPRDGAG